ncbi:hypothetical protein MPLB_950014 [Mesorhizobium sp. ORS 3324]|nr:hypothetical protein MPLB_950014 [Mesorhizobium sp. ORS 3324]
MIRMPIRIDAPICLSPHLPSGLAPTLRTQEWFRIKGRARKRGKNKAQDHKRLCPQHACIWLCQT